MADSSQSGWKPPPPDAGPPRRPNPESPEATPPQDPPPASPGSGSPPPSAPPSDPPGDPSASPPPPGTGDTGSAPPPSPPADAPAPGGTPAPAEPAASPWGPPPAAAGASAPPAPGTPADARGPGWFGTVAASGVEPTEREREHAFYAHLAAAGLAVLSCSLILPILAPVAVYAISKERSPFVVFHVHQSLLFQAACSAAQILITAAGTLSSLFCIGWALYLLGLVPWLGGAAYAFVVSLWAHRGEWRGYAVITDKLLHEWKPFL